VSRVRDTLDLDKIIAADLDNRLPIRPNILEFLSVGY
jgi:hypothetical protein